MSPFFGEDSELLLVEVDVGGYISLMNEFQIHSFRGFSEFERFKYLKRVKELEKRKLDIATIDGDFLSFNEFLMK